MAKGPLRQMESIEKMALALIRAGHNRSNILITGAGGFIGRNLFEYLQGAGTDASRLVFRPTHANLDLLDAHRVAAFVTQQEIDVIIHCANVGGSRKTAYDTGKNDVVTTNLKMFFNLARLVNPRRRMIFMGSGAEYDREHYRPRMPEDYFDTHFPQDPYGFSKYVCAKYIERSEHIVNLRLFGAFGKYEDYTVRFISNAIVKNLLGLPIVINQNVFFDYLYVGDLVRIVGRFLDHEPPRPSYNIATGIVVDLVAIAEKINDLADRPSEIIVRNPGLNTEYSADITRFRREAPDFTFTPFDQALEELYAYYREHLDELDHQLVRDDVYVKYCRTKAPGPRFPVSPSERRQPTTVREES